MPAAYSKLSTPEEWFLQHLHGLQAAQPQAYNRILENIHNLCGQTSNADTMFGSVLCNILRLLPMVCWFRNSRCHGADLQAIAMVTVASCAILHYAVAANAQLSGCLRSSEHAAVPSDGSIRLDFPYAHLNVSWSFMTLMP